MASSITDGHWGKSGDRDSSWPETSADLFRHATADKATLYRSIMEVFAAAKRQYRLQLRPDEALRRIGVTERHLLRKRLPPYWLS
jgi:hypothetical protein